VRPQAVIFDLFGTLVPSILHHEYEQTLTDMAGVLALPASELIHHWEALSRERVTGQFSSMEATLQHICHTLQERRTQGQIAQAAHLRSHLLRKALTPRPDAREALTRLQHLGVKRGLISNCSADVPFLWQETALAPFFEVTLFSCDVGMKKPDPRIYQLACEQLNIPAEACLYLGDGASRELTGAMQVGMRALLLLPPEKERTARRPQAEIWSGPVLSCLREVLTLLP
jgi:putative hydrolase of the HAD superfamily